MQWVAQQYVVYTCPGECHCLCGVRYREDKGRATDRESVCSAATACPAGRADATEDGEIGGRAWRVGAGAHG